MNGLTGWIRLLVLIGPLLMLGFGIYYWFFAPKEANHSMGFRFSYAMSRVEVWQHAQRLAGMAYTALGGILFVIIGLISLRFGKLVAPDMVWLAAKCLLWEVVLVIIATLVVNILIILMYDAKGNARKNSPLAKWTADDRQRRRRKAPATKTARSSTRKMQDPPSSGRR
jgi:uncharacterized membrane protein